jgi:ketosteroid isomerase-like protein
VVVGAWEGQGREEVASGPEGLRWRITSELSDKHEERSSHVSANEDVVRRGYEAFAKGDMDTLRSLMTPDVIQSVPGNTPVSGEHKGVDDVLGYYAELFEMTGGTLKADLQSVKDDGPGKVVAAHRLTAQRGGKSYDEVENLHFTLSGGKISRLDEEHPSLAEFDTFFG